MSPSTCLCVLAVAASCLVCCRLARAEQSLDGVTPNSPEPTTVAMTTEPLPTRLQPCAGDWKSLRSLNRSRVLLHRARKLHYRLGYLRDFQFKGYPCDRQADGQNQQRFFNFLTKAALRDKEELCPWTWRCVTNQHYLPFVWAEAENKNKGCRPLSSTGHESGNRAMHIPWRCEPNRIKLPFLVAACNVNKKNQTRMVYEWVWQAVTVSYACVPPV